MNIRAPNKKRRAPQDAPFFLIMPRDYIASSYT